jgi:CheY-like chemotaxis protein
MKNILIIDDEEAIRSVLSHGLKSLTLECNILTAENGKEAVKILDSVRVDLIVTDLNMPEMDGYELLTYARKNKPYTEVVVMTADYNPEVGRRLRPLGVSKCFEKPFSFKDLAAWIFAIFKLNSPHPLSRMPLSN